VARQVSGSLIAVIPMVPGVSDVDYGMRFAGRDEDLLAHCWTQHLAAKTQLYFSIDQHYQLIAGVHEIRPYLPRRIGPDIAAEAPHMPVVCNPILVHFASTTTHGIRVLF